MGDRQRAGVVRGGGELRRLLQAAEEVRLLEDHAGGLGRGPQPLGIRDAVGVRNVDHLQAEAGAYVRTTWRTWGLSDSARTTLARPVALRDVAGVGGDSRPVVPGGVRDVHAGELADHRLVLEEGLSTPWLISAWYGV